MKHGTSTLIWTSLVGAVIALVVQELYYKIRDRNRQVRAIAIGRD